MKFVIGTSNPAKKESNLEEFEWSNPRKEESNLGKFEGSIPRKIMNAGNACGKVYVSFERNILENNGRIPHGSYGKRQKSKSEHFG